MRNKRPNVEAKVEVLKPDVEQQMNNFVLTILFLCALSSAMLAMFVLPRI